jgi:GNAT superfamily N-acetyltransferase
LTVAVVWRGRVTNAELNALHAEGFDHSIRDDDWEGELARYSLGWVVARNQGLLVGFVNVAWDGGVHAFLLDTVVAVSHRGRGVGRALVQAACRGGLRVAPRGLGEPPDGFYLKTCGFTPTPAGLYALR